MLKTLFKALFYISPFMAEPVVKMLRGVAGLTDDGLRFWGAYARVKMVLFAMVSVLLWYAFAELLGSGVLDLRTGAALAVFAHFNLCVSLAFYMVARCLESDAEMPRP